ncbi:MAG TPA: ectoine/hydroxyectoine ABC transporter permease subunit EhuC [Paenirhodobacter sp.]
MLSFSEMAGFLPALLKGAWLTIEISVVSYVLAVILGLLIGVARISPFAPLRWLAAGYIQFLRGTPLLTQLFFIFYALPYAGVVLSPMLASIIGLTLNYAAYMAEVFRGGIQAVPRGQVEAARALGMRRGKMMRRIIIPQALRLVVPPLGNFLVSIFKDSSLVSVITLKDLTFTGQILAASTFKYFEIFAMVGIIYLMISYPAAKLVEWVERKLDVTGGAGRGF